MRYTAFSLLKVATRPGMRSRGVLIAGRLAIPVVLGRTGIRANKREGDGATPRGRFRLRRLWWRADRSPKPPTLLPTARIDRRIAWCEDPGDRRYNRPFRRSANEPPAPHFALTAKIAARNSLGLLSMGMSADFATAIAFGATHVRVGTAIFGGRS